MRVGSSIPCCLPQGPIEIWFCLCCQGGSTLFARQTYELVRQLPHVEGFCGKGKSGPLNHLILKSKKGDYSSSPKHPQPTGFFYSFALFPVGCDLPVPFCLFGDLRQPLGFDKLSGHLTAAQHCRYPIAVLNSTVTGSAFPSSYAFASSQNACLLLQLRAHRSY